MIDFKFENNNVYLNCKNEFNIALTLDCGQAFRWKQNSDLSWSGAVGNRVLKISQNGDTVILHSVSEKDFTDFWCDYFDLNRDYSELYKVFTNDKTLDGAVKKYYGIRVLNQNPWEALCSFIISQNNNIPRIKGIIERLCESFGEKLSDGIYSFPSAEKIAALTVDDLAPLRAGFRAKYILDAAKKVASNEIGLNKITDLPIENGRTELQKICGVGPKVAECVLLFSCKKPEAFPLDVWMKRVVAEYYPNGIPETIKPYAGIAQQYLFHMMRNI